MTTNESRMRRGAVGALAIGAVATAVGMALAAFAGVLAAPIYQVSPSMGSSLMIVIFAVVVIGVVGMLLDLAFGQLQKAVTYVE